MSEMAESTVALLRLYPAAAVVITLLPAIRQQPAMLDDLPVISRRKTCMFLKNLLKRTGH